MNVVVIDVVIAAVLLLLGVYGLVRALRLRSAGERFALPLARAIGCLVVAAALVFVTAAVPH